MIKKLLLLLVISGLVAGISPAAVKATPKPKAKPKAKVTAAKKVAKKAVKKAAADVSRAQLAAALDQILVSLEAKYSVPLSKDLVLAPSAQPTTRFELASSLAKTLKAIYGKFEIALPSVEAVKLKDVKPAHWAAKDIGLVAHLGIMAPYPDKTFKGTQKITGATLSVAGARLQSRAEAALAGLAPEKLRALQEKYALPPVAKPALPPAPSRVEKALEISSRPQATISGGFGNIYESASGTNNWMSFNGAASYSDTFSLWRFSGNYEITGKYYYNQINYILPRSGGGTSGGVVNENRHELEVNTIYPVMEVFGISGKLLLGAKYINLSNPTAPSNFTGLNAGLVTGAKVFGRNLLLRGFYSLPLMRAVVSPSVLGQPAQLFDYEASLDAEILSYPVLFGLSGETMTLSGGAYRYYNMFFVRYFLI